MKKLVLAMACVLSLGLLASCKNGTQDVNLKNQAATEKSTFAGDASFSVAYMKQSTAAATTGAKTWEADSTITNQSIAYSDALKFAQLSWSTDSDKVDANYTQYKLVIPTVKDTSTTSSAVSDLVYDDWTIEFYKLGDTYYTQTLDPNNTSRKLNTKIELEGNPEDSEFTIKSIGVVSVNRNTVTACNVKFTRK